MDAAKLSNTQLYAIIHNDKLDKQIRDVANTEYERRQLSITEQNETREEHEAKFQYTQKEALQEQYGLLLFTFPLFLLMQKLVPTKYLAKDEPGKWKQYSFIGVFIGIVLLLLFLVYRLIIA
jgi:hypothetical protein